MFQKPQAQDAGSANATDASSPFQLLLSSSVTAPAAADQGGQDTSDSGTNSGKDSNVDGKSAQAQQGGANQIIADSTLIQAIAARDYSQNDGGQTNSSGENTPAPTDDQINDPSAPQVTDDTAQNLAALPDPNNGNIGRTDSASAKPDATAATDALPALTNSDGQNSTAVDQASSGSGDDNQSTASASPGEASSSISTSTPSSAKPGKTKSEGQATAPAQQPADASVQTHSTPQTSAPAGKKDHKADKTRDPKNSDAVANQAPAAAAAIGMVAPAPAPAAADATSSASDVTDDAIAALQAGQAKSAPKNNQAASTPPTGGKTPTPNDQASNNQAPNNQTPGNQAPGDAAKSQSGAQASPAAASSGPKDNSVLPDGNAMPGTAKSASATDD
ncbi:MAG TPA: hypothetical protein VFA87_02400, partial [Rhizomicrobium sp.]|nr:hypothetical protein [Rhizomicrobium sp.]